MNHWETLTFLQHKEGQIEEFRKKYTGCYVWLQPDKGKNDKHLVVFEDFDGTYFYFSNKEGHKFRISYDTNAIVSANFPKTKLFNFGNGFYFFTRIPQRQYKKAPNTENCVVMNPLRELVSRKYHNYLSFSVLELVYAPVYVDWELAHKVIKEEDVTGCAIDSKFALSLHPDDNKQLLWLYNNPIAEVEEGKIVVKVDTLQQEVIDFVKRNKIDVSVV